MEILFLITGILIGAGLTWLALKPQINKPSSGISAEDFTQLDKQKGILEAKLQIAEEEKERLQQELRNEREELKKANLRLGNAEETFRGLNERLKEQRKEAEELQKKLSAEFENIANRILDEKSQKFTEQNKVNLDIILNPLKEKITGFEKKVEEAYDKELRDKISLKEEVKHLRELNTRISEETTNLTKALKGETKTQGNWGEVILEKILERSGLTKGQEYTIQGKDMKLSDEEGKRLQPDVIINLPENKHIVVDSKVSLIAYERCVNCDSEEDREKFLKQHLLSVKKHIDELKGKDYHAMYQINSPEFVLLFIPIEASFGIAVQADQELFNYAWDRHIVIVSPSTLLATLRTIASIWNQEKQNQHALEIARQGGNLYDKFVSFVDDLQKIGNSINSTQKAYDEAWNKLKEGKGNLITRAENIKKLGAKAGKALDQKLVEEAGEDGN